MKKKSDRYTDAMDVCCRDMIIGLGPGTDAEGYGPVIWFVGDKFWASSHPTEMKFCPWCGTKLNEKTLP